MGVNMDINELFIKAKIQLTNLPINTRFELKELFEGYEWKNLEKKYRLNLEKFFKNQVEMNQVPGIMYIGKKSNNHAEYKKIQQNIKSYIKLKEGK